MKVFKNRYLSFSPRDGVFKYLFDRMLINENNNIFGLRKQGERRPPKNSFPKSPAFPLMTSSVFNVLKKDLNIITHLPFKVNNNKFRKKQIRRKCKSVIQIFLGLVYGLDWKKIKTLTYNDVLNLILGIPSTLR